MKNRKRRNPNYSDRSSSFVSFPQGAPKFDFLSSWKLLDSTIPHDRSNSCPLHFFSWFWSQMKLIIVWCFSLFFSVSPLSVISWCCFWVFVESSQNRQIRKRGMTQNKIWVGTMPAEFFLFDDTVSLCAQQQCICVRKKSEDSVDSLPELDWVKVCAVCEVHSGQCFSVLNTIYLLPLFLD